MTERFVSVSGVVYDLPVTCSICYGPVSSETEECAERCGDDADWVAEWKVSRR
jgi:hypothetical protein